MFLELVATIFAGLAAAGVILIIARLTGGRLPKWFVPVGAGLAMLATTVSNEYDWFQRTADTLPEEMVIAQKVEHRVWFRPWTYVKPYVERFVAVDSATVRRHPDRPGERLVDVYFFNRWDAARKLPVLVDCEGRRRADISGPARFEADGTVDGATWIDVPANDPLLTATCEIA